MNVNFVNDVPAQAHNDKPTELSGNTDAQSRANPNQYASTENIYGGAPNGGISNENESYQPTYS